MADKEDTRSTPLGLYDSASGPRITGIEMIAVVLSLLWLLGAGAFFFLLGQDADADTALRFMMTLMVIFLPVAMIWVAATAARSSRVMREESARLQAAIEAIRKTYLAQAQGRSSGPDTSIAKKLDQIAEAQKKTEIALATFSSTRDRIDLMRPAPKPADAAAPEDQAPLPLGTPAEDLAPPLARADFIRALNFPETAEDEEGFAALRKALKDRQAAQLIQASQDILTLLSQDGIYMDDLRPDRARSEIWRRFATGERGRQIAALGGIRDRSSLALSAGRMKQDPIFRDTAHHFLRRFDKMLAEFCETATDSEIADLSDTRTARAFMLLGRVTGMFD
ncbi:hypothetical protein E7681_05810 [Thalassobius vesicularis]|uniref:Uncharacterized protein n=1 Tax=Thalassobius vesicularis TaxID=1294297 RepID=A0A4V3UZB0_9RHOB|nr:hypothetical protein [Thalassobius vesicularis]THD75959.1 hypothetical protein E7681_05810 [Thalassobius vesicularis]